MKSAAAGRTATGSKRHAFHSSWPSGQSRRLILPPLRTRMRDPSQEKATIWLRGNLATIVPVDTSRIWLSICAFSATIDATTGELAVERIRRYRRSHGLELGDALIGASAVQYGERLATFNRRHYPGIRSLASPDR